MRWWLALLLLGACTSTPPAAEKAADGVPRAPSFSLKTPTGAPLESASLAGKPLLVNFWHPA